MHTNINFEQLGGLHVFQNTMKYFQDGTANVLDAIASGFGEKYIVSGVDVPPGSNIASDGYIVVNGEMIKFIGGAILAQVKINTSVADESFDDGTVKPTYTTKTATFSLVGDFDYTELERIPYKNNIGACLSVMERIISGTVQLEPTVIIDGCIVSNIDVAGANTFDISAGFVLFDGVPVITQSQTGFTYPAYILPDGTFDNVEPVSGNFILFDPHTSQRYKNVLKRAITMEDEIIMMDVLSDRFLPDGTGIWEMKGFNLMAAMQSRTPVGLWFDGIVVPNVTIVGDDDTITTGGESEHILSENELPVVNLMDSSINPDVVKGVRVTGTDTGTSFDSSGGEMNSKTAFNLPSFGGGLAHNNRQPYKIIVYAKRVL